MGILADCFSRYPADIFVETGTCTGGGAAEALAAGFRKVVTIELSEHLYLAAVRLFWDEPRVTVIYGDSARILPVLIGCISGTATFWLDAHHSGEGTAGSDGDRTAIEEVAAISTRMRTGQCTILLDDANILGKSDVWMSGVSLQEVIEAAKPLEFLGCDPILGERAAVFS